jgi:hypothetical protein
MSKALTNKNIDKCRADLQESIKNLHNHKIVLRNISAANIGYSILYDRFVFIDTRKARGVT